METVLSSFVKKMFVLLALLLLADYAFARNYDFRHYTNESGLSHNTVYCCLQDSRGFMWFGTKDGLNRFDGHQFKIYRHQIGNELSLRNNYINVLYEGKDGNIWIGTDKGVCYYDSYSDVFHNLDDVWDFKYDVQDVIEDFRENIWIQTYTGLIRYDKKNRTIKHYPANQYFTPHFMCITQSGELWITSERGYLQKYDYRNDTFTEYEILNDKERIAYTGRFPIIDAGIYGLLIGTEERGVKCFNFTSGKVETVLDTDNEGHSIYIRKIHKYSEEEFWIASESGIHIFNIKTRKLVSLRKNPHNPYSIGDNAVYSIIKDKEGGVWVGTYFKGLSYLPPEYISFEKYFNQNQPGDILGNVIREISQDEEGNLWIGTEDQGINKLDVQTGKFRNYSPTDKHSGLKNTNVHGLLVDEDKLWIGYFYSGIDVMDMKTGKVIKHYSLENNKINSDFIIKIYKAKNGDILAGTIIGLLRYKPEEDRFEFHPDLPSYGFVYCIYEDHNGTMWVGTLNSGLYYLTKDGQSGSYVCNEQDINSISSDAVTDIFEDRNNRLWIGTRGNGMSEFNSVTGKFKRYTMETGFPSNFVYKIMEDANGYLWISTSNGLLCFNPDTEEIKRYSKSDGLTNNQFNYNSGYKDDSGRMYFGSIDGMISFVPEKIKESEFIPPVYITSFQVFNEELLPGDKSLNGKSVICLEEIVLPYDKSTFSIEFAALSYTSPETNEYMYRLEGIDKDWVHLKTYNKAHYTNLAPGKYTFKVKAGNAYNVWNETEKSLGIVVRAPFWQTSWAYLLYSVFAVLITTAALNVYSQRLRLKNNLKLEKMESLKEKEVFNAKIDFFTQIAHEIRTPLTLIKGSLDRIIRSEDKLESIKNNLPIMDKNTDRLLNLSNQLLDFRKMEREGMKLDYSRFSLSELIKETFLRFTPMAKERNVTFECFLDEVDYEIIANKEAVTKIISNLFSNALKYAGEKVVATLIPDDKNGVFLLKVSNDGAIIPDEIKEKVFEPFFQYKETHRTNTTFPKGAGIGLFIARSLSELHGGKLHLDTKTKGLNTFIAELPQKQELCISLKEETELSDDNYMLDNETEDSSGRIPVLVVEDEVDMLNFVAEELSEKYFVYKARHGEEALKLIEKLPVKVIVSDISMPVMDGFELCKKLKSDLNYSHIPFILLSAKQAVQAKIEGLDSGADAYIGKPFSTDYLLAQIDNLLKNRAQLIDSFNKSPFLYTNSIASNKADEQFLNKLNDIIIENLSDPNLGVDFLADILGISTSSLYRKMKGISDTNPNEFIRIIRLKKAAELLLNENLSIKEVCYISGFSSSSYFSTSFQKQFGMKPSEFVKKHVKKK